MGTCFVIQPFDRGPFDKRFDEVVAPALQDAGLVPYRVDRDPMVSIPVNDIESGIRGSELCLADITTDNPNVWFELGFAIAEAKEVVLIRSQERTTRLPFDVQHRAIIQYKTQTPADLQQLRAQITQRATAMRQKMQELRKVPQLLPAEVVDGLSEPEIAALVSVTQNSMITSEVVDGRRVGDDMSRAGFTSLAIGLALKVLSDKGIVHHWESKDKWGNTSSQYSVAPKGAQWLLANQSNLDLRSKE
jgi:hypothetical protein